MILQGWTSNLHKQICEELKFNHYSQQQNSAAASIHILLSKQQLNKFKTEHCKNQQHLADPTHDMAHRQMESPYYYSCSHYHSSKDRRRAPYKNAAHNQSDNPIYTSQYISDNFSTNTCINWIEYLYHPNIYKTKTCENPICLRKYCPKLHKGEKIEDKKIIQKTTYQQQQFLSASINQFKQIKQIQNLEECKNLELKQKVKQVETKINNYVEKLNRYDEEEATKVIDIQNQIKNLANNTKSPSGSKVKSTGKDAIKDSNEGNYDLLFYMQQLKIVEDRTHEFKMFKDKDPKRIATLVLEYISAFLNSDGGSIYLGINDQSIVHGIQVSQKWLDQFKLYVDSDGRNDLNPPLIPQKYDLKIIPVNHHKKLDLKVIHIKVFPQSESEKRILTLFKKQCYLRMNASNHRLSASDIIEYMRLVNNKKSTDSIQQIQQKIDSMSTNQLKALQEQISKINTKISNALRKKEKQGQANPLITSEIQY